MPKYTYQDLDSVVNVKSWLQWKRLYQREKRYIKANKNNKYWILEKKTHEAKLQQAKYQADFYKYYLDKMYPGWKKRYKMTNKYLDSLIKDIRKVIS